jgi:CelD/BcsL family acetyltransferase involved in cellulose biosynthesis
MQDVVEHRSIYEISQLGGDWARLLEQAMDADYFQSLDWLEGYWQTFGESQELRVLEIVEAGETVGIVPLVLRSEPTKIGPIRALTYPLDDWGSFYGPVGGDRRGLLQTAMCHVQESPRDWDVVDLRWVHAGENSGDWVLEAMAAAGMKTYRRPRTVVPIARLAGDWESYWATRTGSTRSNLRRYERKVAAIGKVEHIRFRPAASWCEQVDPRWDLYGICERLAALSWQGDSTSGTTLSHEDVRPYLRVQHERAVRSGAIDINLLRVNGRDVAFQYNYHFGGRVSNLRLGFDPEFAKLGVGKVLMMHVLRDSCARGDSIYDFLPRHVEAKRRFATEVIDCHSYFHCPVKIGRTLPLLGKRIYDDWQTRTCMPAQ